MTGRTNIERLADEAVEAAEDDIEIAAEASSFAGAGYIRRNYRFALIAALRASEPVPEFDAWFRENIDVDPDDYD